MEPAETVNTLGMLPIGARLLVRSKLDWRSAAISKIADETVIITVASVSGRTYRIRRTIGSEIMMDGNIPTLYSEHADSWRENFSPFDVRW